VATQTSAKRSRKKVDMDKIAEKALEIIREAGNKGVVQSELWKKLGIDSKRGSRLVQRFLIENRIVRRSIVVGGRKTFLILPVVRVVEIVNIEPLSDIPCFTCKEIDVCGGHMINPIGCMIFSDWLRMRALRWYESEKGEKG